MKRKKEFYITKAVIDITNECNLKCLHCCADNTSKKYLDFETIKEILIQLSSIEAEGIVLSGGEPLLHSRLMDILDLSKRLLLKVLISTNGTLITREFANYVRKYNNLYFHSSVYGSNSSIFDSVTQVKGSFAKFFSGLKSLVDAGFDMKVTYIAQMKNYMDIENTKRLMSSLGVSMSVRTLIFPSRNKNIEVSSLRLPSQILENISLDPLVPEKLTKLLPLYCGIGQATLYIDTNLNVFPCYRTNIVVGDLKKASLEDIWYNKPAPILEEIRRWKESDFEKCSSCKEKLWCFRCPAFSQQEYGSFYVVPEEICRIQKITYAKQIL